MIIFENSGELDMRAVTVMGISAKDPGRSTIGFFGTGLKYAIAVLLRSGHDVWIQPGDGREFTFQKNRTKFRDRNFDIIQMCEEVEDFDPSNITELGFTTELGKQWQVWEAFRELYCNATDEGGTIRRDPHYMRPMPRKGTVRVIASGNDIDTVWANRHDYILEEGKRSAVYSDGEVDLLERKNAGPGTIYYRGVRVGDTRPYNCKFDFNVKTSIDLSEDRAVKYSFQWMGALARMVIRCTNKQIIKWFAMPPQNTLEAEMSYAFTGSVEPSEEFLDTVGALRKKHKDRGMKREIVARHKEYTGTKTVMPTESIKLTDIERAQLMRAKAFCNSALGIDPDEFEIIVAEDLGLENNSAYGLADMDNDIIYVSRSAFRQGTKVLVFTLLEEHTHLKHRVYDETYQQKVIYLEMIAALGEQILGEPI